MACGQRVDEQWTSNEGKSNLSIGVWQETSESTFRSRFLIIDNLQLPYDIFTCVYIKVGVLISLVTLLYMHFGRALDRTTDVLDDIFDYVLRQVGYDMKGKIVSLRERDVVVRGLIEDPTVAASMLSNGVSRSYAASAEMRQLLTLSVPSAALGKDNATDSYAVYFAYSVLPMLSAYAFTSICSVFQ